MLSNVIMKTLRKANELGCTSISIPAISSGFFGFPRDLCANIIFENLKKFVEESKKQEQALSLTKVRLTNFDNPTCEVLMQEFDKCKEKQLFSIVEDQI